MFCQRFKAVPSEALVGIAHGIVELIEDIKKVLNTLFSVMVMAQGLSSCLAHLPSVLLLL